MGDRLPTHLEIAAWRRAVEVAGGFDVVLQKGDRDVGTVLLLTIERGANPQVWERMPQLDGTRAFTPINIQITDFAEYLERRKCQDRDLWIVELDISNPERFVDLRPG